MNKWICQVHKLLICSGGDHYRKVYLLIFSCLFAFFCHALLHKTKVPIAQKYSLSKSQSILGFLFELTVHNDANRLFFMAQCLFGFSYFVPLLLSVKARPVRMPPGYQADLVIQLVWVDGEPPQQITSLAVNSAYGL